MSKNKKRIKRLEEQLENTGAILTEYIVARHDSHGGEQVSVNKQKLARLEKFYHEHKGEYL